MPLRVFSLFSPTSASRIEEIFSHCMGTLSVKSRIPESWPREKHSLLFHLRSFCLDPFSFLCAKSLQSCPTLCDSMDHSPPGSCPWDCPGKNTEVGCHALLQRIFPTQGSNPCLLSLLHWVLYHFTTWGSPNDYSTKRLQLYQKGNQLCWLAELKLQCWEILKHTVSYSEIFSMTFVFMLPLYRAPSTWK